MGTSVTDVLIVGAGPTGLTLACDLARRGVGCRLVERGEGGFPGSRGAGIQPRSREVFEDLGILDAVHEDGSTFPTMMRWDGPVMLGTTEVVQRNPPTPDRPYGEIWMLPQWRTVDILRTRFKELGGHVEHSRELTHSAQNPDHVIARVLRADGTDEEIRAAYLVAADGGRSTVRESLGLPFERTDLAAPPMLIGDAVIDGLDPGYWHIWPTAPGGMVTLIPVRGSGAFAMVVQYTRPGEEPDAARDGSTEALQQLLRGRTGCDITVREILFISTLRTRTAVAGRFRTGRVFLAGDAAHIHPPTGGQGLNTGVQDAYNLGWKLEEVLHRNAPPQLLDTYHAERQQVAADLLRRSSGILSRDQEDSRTGWTRRGDDTLQLDLTYRGGPLAIDRRPTPADNALQAGDRAPDAPCTDASGAPVRLFDIFRGPHFTLLAFGDTPTPRLTGRQVRTHRIHISHTGPSTLRDTDSHARTAYADTGLFLIRPDGYIALATHDPNDVTAYLSWQHLTASAAADH
ncbi:FAD-dependent monooxygenase [Streptomyces sp. NPDC020965]|uniref:FAD-dependent monooxygenase n=1 Tax=Streptomyces sp. NPDC020965 TaxID=3365105 RepID=UPI0037A25195